MKAQHVSLYRQTLAQRQQQYDTALASGEYTPFLYPWDSLPILYMLVALAITPKLPKRIAKRTRYTAFVLIVAHSLYIFRHRRTLWFAGGYGIGLALTWGAIMSFALLVCNDVGRDFWRLEVHSEKIKQEKNKQNGSTTALGTSKDAQDIDLTKRKIPSVYTSKDVHQKALTHPDEPGTEPYSLLWQGFPYHSGWLHLMDWIVDLTTGFRGVNWSHRIAVLAPIDSPIPPRPESNRKIQDAERSPRGKTTAIPQQNLRALRYQAIKDFFISYLILDFLKTTMVTDPYFIGIAGLESPTPWTWLQSVTRRLPIATRFVRLVMSLTGVVSALTFIFSLSPLFFTIILPAIIDISKITKSPLLEPWMYPPHWYPLQTSVMNTGLAGFWGKFWHQMFRFGISEPSRVLIDVLQVEPRGNVARLVQLGIAFVLSGSIHAAGSYTCFSLQQTHPFSGPLLFFLSQGVGIFLQTAAVKALHHQVPPTKSVPAVIGKVTNLVVVLIWLYLTGPLLANDFARCGIWLFEPVPLSILRGLGFGPGGKDEGWWAWYQEGSRMVGWWSGDRFWEAGLAIY